MLRQILVCLLFIFGIQTVFLAANLETTIAGSKASGSPLPVETGDTPGKESKIDIIQMIKYGGIVGHTIILLSVVALALVIEYALTIRKKALMPPKTVNHIRDLIKENRHREIANHCGTTFIGKVVGAGMAEADYGYDAMVRAMEDSGEECIARLARKVEHLNIIGTITPMLGLLGTVIGMLITFNTIYEASKVTGIVDPRELAGGIFKAIVTTVQGLIVAIPSLYAYALFRNRVDSLFTEVMTMAEKLISPFKPIHKDKGKLSEN